MIKKVFLAIIGLVFGLAFFVPQNVFATYTSAQKDYDYRFLWQNRGSEIIKQGRKSSFSIELRNIGRKTWYNNSDNPMRLGSGSKYGNGNQGYDYINEFDKGVKYTEWISDNRVALNSTNLYAEVRILPGETARFNIDFGVPENMKPGAYRIYFTPVIDGIAWMKDVGIYYSITVIENNKTIIDTSGKTVKVKVGDTLEIIAPNDGTYINYDEDVFTENILQSFYVDYFDESKDIYEYDVVGSGATRFEKGDFIVDIIAEP